MAQLLASDGLIARDSGPWAREKLNYLRRYMEMVTTSMAGKWGGLVFIDLMAGPGVCIDRTDDSEFIGSPLHALGTHKPWTRVYLIELDDDLRAALEQRIAKHDRAASVVVLEGDSNRPGIIARLRRISEGTLGLAFVDLVGQEIAFETIRTLADGRNIDLWFSFPEYDLQRNATLAPRDADQAKRWTRFFGTEAWEPIVRLRRPRPALVELRKLYETQLQSLGYLTAASRLPMVNSRKRSMYRPLLATRDPRGIDFFQKALLKSGVDKPPTLADLW